MSLEHINIMKIYSFSSDNVVDFNDKIKKLAKINNIEFTEEKISAEELKKQFNAGCDLVFCAGYAYRIPVERVEGFRGINIHPSLLPKGRGPWPIPYVILNDEKIWGVTAHKLAERIDEGDILLSEEFEVSEKENYLSLCEKISESALNITKKLMSDLDYYSQNAKKQCKGTYLAEPPDEQRTIYNDTPPHIKDKIIRAFGKDYVIYK